MAINSCEIICDPPTAYRSALRKLESTWCTHEAASMERVKKLNSGKVIGANDLNRARELLWEVEKVIAHTKLTEDVICLLH